MKALTHSFAHLITCLCIKGVLRRFPDGCFFLSYEEICCTRDDGGLMLFSVLTMGNMRTIQHTLPLRLAKHSLGLTEKASAWNKFVSFRHWPSYLHRWEVIYFTQILLWIFQICSLLASCFDPCQCLQIPLKIKEWLLEEFITKKTTCGKGLQQPSPSFFLVRTKSKSSIIQFGLDLWSGYLLHLGEAQQKRCNGADAGCCTKANPCGEGEGDCDRNEECKGHFVTKSSNR